MIQDSSRYGHCWITTSTGSDIEIGCSAEVAHERVEKERSRIATLMFKRDGNQTTDS